MINLLVQTFFAGPGDETDGWMNILLLMVLAVFWIVGSILKAASQKTQDKQKQPPIRKPVRKVRPPTTVREASSSRPTKTVQSRPQPRPRPAIPPMEVDTATRPQIAEPTKKTVSYPPKPQAESVLQNLPEFASKPLVELDHMRLGKPQKITEEEELPELVLDFADPDELSKAILHYEILGPPVSLRNPSH